MSFNTSSTVDQDWRTLFRFLLSVIFAKPHELGYDPTMMKIRDDDGDIQYEIMVRSESGEEHRYRTVEVLSAPGEAYLIGRGTQVWKAMRVEDGQETGESIALKDAWVDDHREREGIIESRIRSDASSSDQGAILENRLVHVVCHGDVFVESVQDCTRLISPGDSPGVGSGPSSKHQVHYRIVYREIGTSLYEETSLAKVFRALGDVADGLSHDDYSEVG